MCSIPSSKNVLQGVEPVLRTYNTLMICNNMCHQPRETMNMYKRMTEEGFTANATTYNALISAYGKSGQLDKVMPPDLTANLSSQHSLHHIPEVTKDS